MVWQLAFDPIDPAAFNRSRFWRHNAELFGAGFSASAQATAKVFLVCGAGAILERQGKLPKDKRRFLNRLAKDVFLPSLLISKVANSVTADVLAATWPLLVFTCLYVAVGCALGALMWTVLFKSDCKRTRFPETSPKFLMACIGFANTTSLPLALVEAVLQVEPALHVDEDGNATATGDEALGRATTYIMVTTFYANLLRWTVAFYLMSPLDEETRDAEVAMIRGNAPQHQKQSRACAIASAVISFFRRRILNPPIVAIFIAIPIGLISPPPALFVWSI